MGLRRRGPLPLHRRAERQQPRLHAASYVERAREKRAEAREKRALAHLDEIRAERDGGYALEMDAPLSIPGLGTITPSNSGRAAHDP